MLTFAVHQTDAEPDGKRRDQGDPPAVRQAEEAGVRRQGHRGDRPAEQAPARLLAVL